MSGKVYLGRLNEVIGNISVTDSSFNEIDFDEAVRQSIEKIQEAHKNGNKLMFIGNGGSAAIASHSSTDYFKNGGIRSICFNEATLLTCIGNDYGYEEVFTKPIEMIAVSGDILIAISSSGKSPNILNAVKSAIGLNCKVITLSGFSPENPLRQFGELNFYVPSDKYGYVELVHQIILHSIVDIMKGYY
ncbi:D-sedoheptulose-7-phosphate isomerase [Acetivibrio cellulolyticus]|uniref:D-sedoheptulose-7-phosphate isomerase n=1 Tax=Acetivibrio cellulolyticus TaxID=35830 RepID=UPI0001E2E350|nr:SIS domain-containing protein [Acetivibrio cellulolyticus]